MKTEAEKNAQKKYDLEHKEQFKNYHFKVSKERYGQEIALLDSMKNKQGFLFYLLTSIIHDENLTLKEIMKRWKNQ